jgi:hypothetical protein
MKDNNIFKDVAIQNGVTESEVRREIEKTIAEACKDPDAPINNIGKGRVPTPEEVMEYVMKEVAKSNMS